MLPWPGMEKVEAEPGRARVFRIFASLFTLSMLVAVTINNVALMWVAIEATTIVSAILIPLHRSKASVEASWKYILIGSVGIALAFAGTVLAYFDFVSLLGRRQDALNWTLLMEVAPAPARGRPAARLRVPAWSGTGPRPASRRCTRGCPTRTRRRRRRCRP